MPRRVNLWEQLSERYGVAVHAYCLMTNHVYFLATPSCPTALSNPLKIIGSRYAQYITRPIVARVRLLRGAN